ncbi:hypothetical protein F7R20_05030 [Pseudomonas brassicacearum subsp. brassicacearum]|nr:hypothetical protein F7R20_05030 [Pseudomonas brassicacearum subsp. brassicacearum]QEO77816.1 hypothetical protein ELZ14_09695 [Pseudomonas brassicacearum]
MPLLVWEDMCRYSLWQILYGSAASPAGALVPWNLWEQSLLAMNDDAVLLLNRIVCIASKLCSHRAPLAPTVFACAGVHNGRRGFEGR